MEREVSQSDQGGQISWMSRICFMEKISVESLGVCSETSRMLRLELERLEKMDPLVAYLLCLEEPQEGGAD